MEPNPTISISAPSETAAAPAAPDMAVAQQQAALAAAANPGELIQAFAKSHAWKKQRRRISRGHRAAFLGIL